MISGVVLYFLELFSKQDPVLEYWELYWMWKQTVNYAPVSLIQLLYMNK